MTENHFLNELNQALARLPEEERKDILQDIQEYFANGRQDGKSEDDIASELGSPQAIAEELMESYNFSQSENSSKAVNLSKSTFDKVDVEIDTGSLTIHPSVDDEMHVDVEDQHYKQQLFVDVLDRTLVVTLKNEKKWGFFSFNTNMKSPAVTIQLPQKMYEHIKLHTDNGRIAGTDLQSVKFDAKSDNGRIQLRRITANRLVAESDNGDVELRTVQADMVVVKTDNGKIDLQDIQAKEVELETDNGSISLENVNGNIQAETDNGRIHLLANDIERNIDLKSDNGNIVVETMSDPANVTIQADRDHGKAIIFNEKGRRFVFGEGRHNVRLKTDNGNLTVKRV
ncbi:DUF4097 family beta strand repeat-containing protein [Planococcus shixiaomingii]|uniref:DUF4097 family beta strand repeat-containing protein n=1 Tax=Planococcus shixiaomingii TaxID=3058393 RepID=UPI00260373D3|nr:DUF4097 family beta strand repeat-containing protein [Planococcus sp. N022]WKA54241.1 DUF4097 family beta strand repeat-containing protein [Planococcus sp. N022]